MPAEDVDPRVDTVLGNYRLKVPIGQGGMGVVYRAEHVHLGKPVAVKVLHERFLKSDDAVQRFLREARAASLIAHPNIVDVHDFGEAPDGGVYFVMEYLDGEPLDVLLRREQRLPLFRALNILNQIAHALGAAHEKGIVHRDLKPENVFLEARKGRRELVHMLDYTPPHGTKFRLEREGDFDFVKVLDFGVAKIVDNETLAGEGTVAGTIFGTPEYMAPEAARGEPVTPLVDVYALGILFYEMLTGAVPFEAKSAVEVLSMQITRAVPLPSTVSVLNEVTPPAESFIMSCLDKEPRHRPQSMVEVRARLLECYGSVRFLRDADRIPGAEAAGLAPKLRQDVRKLAPSRERITDEIRDLLKTGALGPMGASETDEGEARTRLSDELKDLLLPGVPDPPKRGQPNEPPVLLTNVKAAEVPEDTVKVQLVVKREPR